MQHSCTICLGSNTPDQEEQIKKAIEHLKEQLSEVEVSATYRSAAYNGKDAPYLNAVVHGYTDRSIEQMETDLKLWERNRGGLPRCARRAKCLLISTL